MSNSDVKKIEKLTAAAKSSNQKTSDKAILALIKFFGNKDAEVRKTVVSAFDDSLLEQSIPHFITALKNRNYVVRYTTVFMLGHCKDPKALKLIIQSLGDDDARVRSTAARILGDIDSLLAINGLINALGDPDPRVSIEAAKSLGRHNCQENVEDSLRFAQNNHNNFNVRRIAKKMLETFS